MRNSLFILLLLAVLGFSCRQVSTNEESQAIEVPKTDLPARVDTLEVHSPSMNKPIKAVVVAPGAYYSDENQSFSVIYLLHGAYGDHLSWIKSSPLAEFANTYNSIIVCPDGESTSWYLDSPVDPSYRYETFVSQELVSWVDQHYRTVANRQGRAICGLSMGGHGAFYLAFRHQDVFGASGSIAGGVDIRPFPQNWDLAKRLGPKSQYPQNWLTHSVVGQLDALEKGKLALKFDCGEQDFFFEVNEALHDSLERRGIEHSYETRKGEHNWEYFSSSLPAHLEFFKKYFDKNM